MSEFVENLKTAIRAGYIEYRGRKICKDVYGWLIGDKHYDTIEEAKGAIDTFYQTWNRLIKRQNSQIKINKL